ncbi:MAG: hypothetical protein PHF89_02095 [Eubacteriales bacterium]|nr:hypothetical protein [Eubacteriales bacterium]
MQIQGISFNANKMQTPDYIKKEITALGGNPSNDMQSDIQLLTKLKASGGANKTKGKNNQAKQTEQSNQAQGGPPQQLLSLMQKLGIEPQGSPEKDMQAITDKIEQLEKSAKTEAEVNNVKELKSELQGAMAAAANTQMPQAVDTTQQLSGLSQLGNNNRAFHGL